MGQQTGWIDDGRFHALPLLPSDGPLSIRPAREALQEVYVAGRQLHCRLHGTRTDGPSGTELMFLEQQGRKKLEKLAIDSRWCCCRYVADRALGRDAQILIPLYFRELAGRLMAEKDKIVRYDYRYEEVKCGNSGGGNSRECMQDVAVGDPIPVYEGKEPDIETRNRALDDAIALYAIDLPCSTMRHLVERAYWFPSTDIMRRKAGLALGRKSCRQAYEWLTTNKTKLAWLQQEPCWAGWDSVAQQRFAEKIQGR
jgi:hypothetical protein